MQNNGKDRKLVKLIADKYNSKYPDNQISCNLDKRPYFDGTDYIAFISMNFGTIKVIPGEK